MAQKAGLAAGDLAAWNKAATDALTATAPGELFFSDLGHDYVTLNADYTT